MIISGFPGKHERFVEMMFGHPDGNAIPANTKHLYNISTMLDQPLRLLASGNFSCCAGSIDPDVIIK